VSSAEDGAGWLVFLRGLTARGLSGFKLVTSDAHSELVAAIGATLPGASWQPCRTHYAVNLKATCPAESWPRVKTMLHSVFDQVDVQAVHAQFDRLLDAVADKLPKAADHLEAARADLLAFTAFPKEVWRQIWSNNLGRAPQPRDPPAHRRRGIFPDGTAIIRLVGAVLAEQHDEWAEGRRYLALDVLARARLSAVPDTQEVTTPQPPALSASPLKITRQPSHTTPRDLTPRRTVSVLVRAVLMSPERRLIAAIPQPLHTLAPHQPRSCGARAVTRGAARW